MPENDKPLIPLTAVPAADEKASENCCGGGCCSYGGNG